MPPNFARVIILGINISEYLTAIREAPRTGEYGYRVRHRERLQLQV